MLLRYPLGMLRVQGWDSYKAIRLWDQPTLVVLRISTDTGTGGLLW